MVDPQSNDRMLPRKTPTSSLSGGHINCSALHHLTVTTTTAIELLAKRIWYRSRARIRRIRSRGASLGTCTTRSSPITRLPQEIIETIIAHLMHDLFALRSCSLTCYFWYIATVPHLHPTLNVYVGKVGRRFRWPNPIRCMHAFGLLPFVKTLHIRGYPEEFSPKLFNRRILHQFSTLTNVQRFRIDSLDIPSFIPRIRRYFGPLLPTLRSLHLTSPKGSNREIIFFIGFFQHLENLSLTHHHFHDGDREEDLTLIPPSAPPLQGRLVVRVLGEGGFFPGHGPLV